MASEAPIEGSKDPLSGLFGPMLFPRTIRASAGVPVPADVKDLESIHIFMKSLELTSPETVMNEAKRIVDGGAELLESNLTRFTKNEGITDTIATKGKGGPQERRPGLGLARKRAPFSLRTNISLPSVSLESTLNIKNLQDPDEFFDAYERMEKAKKEIEKQLGGNRDNIKHYKPSNNARRRRREGILGKSYKYKHRYSSEPYENDMLMLSPEMMDQDVAISPKDKSQENLEHPEPIPDTDLEEVKLATSKKKTDNGLSDILEELLSCNNEDLEGDGALNLLQERLKFKPLDLENLCTTELPGLRRTSTFNVTGCVLGNARVPTETESLQKHRRSSPVIGGVLKLLSQKPMDLDQCHPLNPALPTPPRSPFTSISSLQKRMLQPYPLRDPFSPTNVDLPDCQNASSAPPKNKLLRQVELAKDLGLPNEFDSCVEVDKSELVVSNMDTQNEMGNKENLPKWLVDENASIRIRNDGCKPNEESDNIAETMNVDKNNSNLSAPENASPAQPKNKLLGQVEPAEDLGLSNELEQHVDVDNRVPVVSTMDAQNKMGNEDNLPEHNLDENASVRSRNEECRPNEESDTVEEALNFDKNNSNPSVPENEARDDTSGRKQTEQQPEVHKSKSPKGRRVAGEKRIRKALPMRKSLAEAGTSFEAGVRRSKRIKMRPLEYWRGEKFLYGRVNDSFKLLGVKYISPGKDNEKLKVKPYIPSELPEYEEVLELAARH